MNNEIKPQLKALLSSHQGRASAITRRELRDMLEVDEQDDREFRKLIAELRFEGAPVLFATTKPAGYYVPATWEELRVGLDSFRSYIIDLCVQRAKIKKAGELSLYSSKQGLLL